MLCLGAKTEMRVLFNNKETGQAREDQAEELLTMASKVIKCGGQHKHRHKYKQNKKKKKNIQEKPSKLLSILKKVSRKMKCLGSP